MNEVSKLSEAISFILATPWWLIPTLLFGLIWVLCRVKPEYFLSLFGNYKEIYEDLVKVTGPRLTRENTEKLGKIREKQRLALSIKNKSERILKRIYNQESLNISGFNRALLIASLYPIFLIVESIRVCRRLIILRELANEQKSNVFPRSPRASSSHGFDLRA